MNPWLLLALLAAVAVVANACLGWHDRRQRARRAAARQPPDGPGSGILTVRASAGPPPDGCAAGRRGLSSTTGQYRFDSGTAAPPGGRRFARRKLAARRSPFESGWPHS